jgi:hypothetical protein
MRVGGQHSEECNDPQIRYRGWILKVYIGNDQHSQALGFTLETINIVKHSDKYRFFFQVIITDKAKARRGGGKVSVL